MTNKKRFTISILCLLMLIVSMFAFSACGGKVENFNLSFKVDGKDYSTISTNGSEIVTIPENPIKEGYEFDGWYWDKDVWNEPFTANSLLNAPISSDMSVYARFNAISYDITYETDDGTHSNPVSYTIEDSFALSDAEKAGYNFVGWYADNAYTTEVTSISTGSMGAITLYAKYEVATYSITYENTKDATNDNPTSYTIESATIALKNLEKLGYTFDGWYNDGTKVTEIVAGSTGNLVLTAQWTPVSYSITYENTKDATNDNPTSYTIESATIPLENLEKLGYTFDGWYNNSTKVTEIAAGSTGNLVLTAQWTPVSYSITYENTKDATNDNPTSYTIESATITLENLEKLGYTFDGWYNNGTKVTEIVAGSAGNLVLTAQWTPIGYEIKYHNIAGATHSNPDVYDVEDQPLALSSASKTGYTFTGWYTDSACQNKINEVVIGTTGELNLYAGWEIIEYTATFKDGNDTVKEVVFTVETDSIEEPIVPTRDGYNSEWANYVLEASNITIYVEYTPIIYTITYENTKNAANDNATSYTIESATIMLKHLEKQGYTFDGWYNNGAKVTEIPTGSMGDLILTAQWTAIQYKITYMYDHTIGDYADTAKNPDTYTVEDDFDFIALINKTNGYTFNGWFTEKNNGTGELVSGIKLGSTGEITVYAQWGLKDYTITYYNVNGGTNTNAKSYTVETETFTIEDVSKIGYQFEGWFANEALTIPADTTIEKGTYGNLSFYAKWTLVEYSITYVLYGDTTDDLSNPDKYTTEDSFTLNEPIREGYIFVGWYTSVENGDRVTTIEENTTGNKTFYARWLKFESNGGSEVSYIPTYNGNKISAPKAPTKTYYNFVNWYTDIDLTQQYNFVPTKSITLYAKWAPVEYAVEYVLGGGNNAPENPTTYTVENNVILHAANKMGYTFVGWFTDANFTSAVVTEIPKGTSGKITLYAHYNINQYTIRFESNGGTSIPEIKQNFDTEVKAPEKPAKNGYEFAGWYSDTSLKNKYTFTTIPAENITLYAKWNMVTYNIKYNLEGGTNNSSNPSSYIITSGEIVFKVPTKEGYDFAGWYSDSGCTNSIAKIASGSYGDVELFAKWTPKIYTVIYYVPEGATHDNPESFTAETDLHILTNAKLKGYTFGGWFSDGAYTQSVTSIAGGSLKNVTLYANFTVNTYNVWLDGDEAAEHVVSFDLNGAQGSISAQTITPTATLKFVTAPEREGYIFGGWYESAMCTGAPYDFSALITKDMTLYAKWIKLEKASPIFVNGSESVKLNGRTEDMLAFVPLVSGNVTITSSGDYDTFGTLYNSSMTALIYNDDGAADEKNFHIVYNVTAGETYYIGARAFSSTTIGSATVSISGNTTVLDGGYAITTSQTLITYGEQFTLTLPEARDGYKFLGYADENGAMYTDVNGNSIKAWDKDEDTILYSAWERAVYTVTFETSGGTAIEPITLAFGERFDIAKYSTSRDGYTFNGWYLDGVEYNATTMPDRNITLTAYWKTFALGTIKYDTDKKAISVNDEITAELFEAICLDTNGKLASFTVSVSGTQAVGETITVRLVATSGNKTKQITITDVKVYGMPTLTFDNTVEYVNVVGGMTATHFGASGLDTFGASTDIKVYIDGEYNVGTGVKIVIEAIDVAGNITYGYIENVKAYGLPVISYNDTKAEIKTNDKINAELFNATAVDSFGEPLSVTVTKYSGTIAAGNTVVIRITATDSKGNITNIDVECDVYGVPTISNASKTDVKVSDTVTPELLGITATDTYDNPLVVALSTKQGSQTAGVVWVVTATVTDAAGNVATKDYNLKVYGAPNITYDRDGVNVTENAATDSYAISFDLNGGNGSIANQTVTTTVGLVYPEIPTRSGYVFKGWYTTADCITLFDFSANVTKDTTVYAGWHPMTTSGAGSDVMLVYGDNNSSSDYYSLSTKGTSRSNALYTYFAILKDGTYKLYYKNGSSSSNYRTYITVYNETQQTTIKSNTYISSTSFSYVSFTAKAGDVLYVKNYRYSTSSSSYYTTFSMYLNGAVTPTAGGLIPATGAHRILNATATDSFGNTLTVNATLKSGTLTVGTYVVYTLTATDHLGNTYSMDTEPLGVYDSADIKLEYSAGMSDLIKLTSKGEEFGAKATDSFGNLCEISIEAAEGYTLAGGNTISLYIVATDKAGNKEYSELISDIKVYDLPEIICKRANTIDMDSDPSFFFQVNDSFGEELYFTTTVIGEMKVGNYVDIKLVVSDDAGHYIEKLFTDYYVKESDKVLIKFIHSDDTEELLLLNRDGKNFPTRELDGWQYVWTSKPDNEGTVYDGTFQIEDDYLVLYAEFIKTVNLSLNSGTYTGSTTVTVIYQDSYSFGVPKRSSYEFLGWYDANSGGTLYVDASGRSVFDAVEEDFPSTLYARWAAIYKITYYLNGGTKPSYNYPSQYTAGRSYSLGTPTKTGYDFGGWYTNSSLTNKLTSITSTTTGNLTLYAKWTAKTYTITLQTAGTISSKSYKVTYGSTYTLPVPTMSGYTFLGWKLSDAKSTSTTITGTSYKATCTMLVAKSTGASVSAYTYTENKTYVAVWQTYLPQTETANGWASGGSGSYSTVVIGKGTYKFAWTIGNPGTDKSYAVLGDTKFTSKSSYKTFKVTEDDRVYSIQFGVFITGYGSNAAQTGSGTFSKTA